VILAGEITTKRSSIIEAVVSRGDREIGYVNKDDVFPRRSVFIKYYLTEQSPDIAQGVDAVESQRVKKKRTGAGDQGLMFGYACNETPELIRRP